MTINLPFTDHDWRRMERNWRAWWEGALPRALVIIEEVTSLPREAEARPLRERDFASNFPLDSPTGPVIDHYQVRLQARRYHGDAWPKWWPNFGPGIGAGFLGARVLSTMETVWFEPAQQVNISDLCLAYDADNPWWRRVQELTAAAVARWGDAVCVGYTDIGGNLDILASLVGTQQLLYELVDRPGEVLRMAGEITRLWLRYYNELDTSIRFTGRGSTPWAPIWSPGRCYMLQCDFSAMISPAMFERFVLPDLAACCRVLDHSLYHMDGPGQVPHLDLLLSLARLDGIQWIPGEGALPPEAWLPLLARIRKAGKLCQLYVTPAGARTIVKELGGRGFALYIDQSMTAAEAAEFERLLAREDRLHA